MPDRESLVVAVAIAHERDAGADQSDRKDQSHHPDRRAHAEVEGAAERAGEVGVDREGRDEAEADEPEPPDVGPMGLQRGEGAGFGRGAVRLGWPPPLLGGHSDHRRYQQPHQQHGTARIVKGWSVLEGEGDHRGGGWSGACVARMAVP